MIHLKKNEANKAIITEMELAGEKFNMELLPFSEKDYLVEMAQFQRRKSVYNPISKKMEVQVYYDENEAAYIEVMDTLLDKIVKNFWGIADGHGELDGTLRENKLLLASVKVTDFEEIPVEDVAGEKGIVKQKRIRPFRTLILEKAFELAGTTAEVEEKNS